MTRSCCGSNLLNAAASTSTSRHWHIIILPQKIDGIPGLSFAVIEPSGVYVCRFKVQQNGTYWYHSDSGF
ncbi:twin-arginine translocation pathway signal protein [Pseudomonas avellanae]|uniref:Twin-arginine translocation pathway signal protein n=1 Tax=Pseudomonas avellanae TaxID=46257 RepID=A0A261WKQ4_9PSED|nr:twin-arginine translocation pathway signal protein [Pseudomonas avellanae]